ncbi:hypothetical protein AWB98_01425 [Mycolicibacterium conceptionense]|uniref:DUF732 domain-containing protein n=1 Tax=Mycolicibacterium conceptionense TaxID=451644 RepID=A0ABX3V0J1_9MYCO|nr:hypothetical protein AWB98_01425 [Mycolicibacterium conceptionense]
MIDYFTKPREPESKPVRIAVAILAVVVGIILINKYFIAPANAEPTLGPDGLEGFVTKVVCTRLAEGGDPSAMARQLVTDKMVGSEKDGRLLIQRAASVGCPAQLGRI